MTTGNDIPSTADVPYGLGNTLNAMSLEAMTVVAAGIFRARATALGVSARVDIVNGTNNWPTGNRPSPPPAR